MKRGRSTGRPTAGQAARWDDMREIGCIACLIRKVGWVPCQIHHLTIGGRHGQKRRGHDFTIGLCPWHHVGEGDADFRAKYGPSYAKEPRAFREAFGNDDTLLEIQNTLLARYHALTSYQPAELLNA